MTSHGSVSVINNTSLLADQEDAKHRVQQRKTVQAAAHKKDTYMRKHLEASNWHALENSQSAPVAPKWRRHQEDYINPHLLPHERDPIAPRYGPDSVSHRLRPQDYYLGCSCSYCKPALHRRAEQKRETHAALKSVVAAGPGSGRARMGTDGRLPWADWDWNGQNDPYAYGGDEDWMLDYQVDKCAPAATVDLLAMAKPAKGKRRAQASVIPGPASRSHNLARARTFLEPVATGSNTLPDIDEISILDYEETWEHLDLERLDDGVHGSEWGWERFSQFSA